MTAQRSVTTAYDSELADEQLRAAFTNGRIPVAVYGLGKMGLPLAAVYADVTGSTVGVDIDETVVDAVEDRTAPVKNEPGLDELVAETVAAGHLRATTDGARAAREAAVHVVIVPTLITDDGSPDLSTLRAAVETIASGLSAGDLVVVESTVPPGTCRDVVGPTLAAESGLDPDAFGVAFCPERTMSGRALTDIRGSYPKVVGGIDEESTRVAEQLYREINERGVVTVSDSTTAECVKVFEGVYRDVNIALANELARFTDSVGVDVREAIETANTIPQCDIHDPGPGVGGHCIPYYPHFLIDQFTTETPLLKAARSVNDGMPEYTVATVRDELARLDRSLEDASIVVFGVTYRPGVDESRASPAIPITTGLARAGADVYAIDPICTDFQPFDAVPIDLEDLGGVDPDAVVIVTGHATVDEIPWGELTETVVVDGRDVVSETPHRTYTLGRGVR